MVRLAAEHEDRVVVGDAARLPLADGLSISWSPVCACTISSPPR
jgi:hypothetical protein